MTVGWSAARAMAVREIRRFYRQPGRLIGAIGTPAVFWALLGGGFGHSLVVPGDGALRFFYPGMVLLTILFTAVFASLPVIEDRRGGFLRAALVTPAPRAALALGLAAGGAMVAAAQAAVLLLAARPLGYTVGPLGLAEAAAVCALLSVGCAALGVAAAWRAGTPQAYHAVMNVVLIPGWLLSGAVFPADGAQGWVRLMMQVNPLSFAVAAIRQTLGDPPVAAGTAFASVTANVVVLAAFALLAVAWAAAEARRTENS